MFESFYGLTFNPFDKAIPEDKAFQSGDHKEMLSRLEYLKTTRGVGLFLASPGMGKTYALRCFAKNINPSLYQLAYVCLSTVSVSEFYHQFCHELGLDYSNKKSVMFRSIQDRLYTMFKEKRITFMLAVDESQYLTTSILRDIKMLLNTRYDSLDCFALALIGQPYLGSILGKPVHESLKQRIRVHYNFEGLTADESKSYIYSMIQSAGGAQNIIDEAAVLAVANCCHGTPRVINNVMTNALMIGNQTKKHSIDIETIMRASESLALN